MKILTLVWSIGVGGTERAAVNYAIGYKEYGLDSRVLVLGEDKDRLQDLINASVETYCFQKGKLSEEDILGELQTWSPDIIHLHNYTPAYIPYLNKLKADKTRVVETNVFSRPYFDEQYKIVSLSMQLSLWGHWKYTHWMKGAAYIPDVSVAPYTVYQDKFTKPTKEAIAFFLQKHEIPEGAFVAGRLGQAHPSKWDNRILQVVKRTVSPENNIYYFFVGMPEKLKEKIKSLPAFVQSRIKLLDEIRGDDKLSLYYHSLNCFVHISKIGESFGYVLAEAMMCKTPVITMLTPFHDNAQFEVVGHNKGGICVRKTDEFVSAVLQLYTSKSYGEKFKQNFSNHWLEKRFGSVAVIPAMVETFKQLLIGKKPDAPHAAQTVQDCLAMYSYNKYWMMPFLKFYNSRIVFIFISRIKKYFR